MCCDAAVLCCAVPATRLSLRLQPTAESIDEFVAQPDPFTTVVTLHCSLERDFSVYTWLSETTTKRRVLRSLASPAARDAATTVTLFVNFLRLWARHLATSAAAPRSLIVDYLPAISDHMIGTNTRVCTKSIIHQKSPNFVEGLRPNLFCLPIQLLAASNLETVSPKTRLI